MTKSYKRRAYEKIWNVLQEIQQIRITKSSDRDIILTFDRLEKLVGLWPNAFNILKGTLRDEEKAIDIYESPTSLLTNSDLCDDQEYKINILPKKFDPYFKKIEAIYENNAREFEQNKLVETKEQDISSPEATIYRVDYGEMSGEIRINNFFLSKPDYDSKNELLFKYLYKNPNIKITRKDIEKDIPEPINKRFHNIVNELGFAGNLQKAFFRISKTSIIFRNPIKKKDLQDLGINWLELKPKQKKSREYYEIV